MEKQTGIQKHIIHGNGASPAGPDSRWELIREIMGQFNQEPIVTQPYGPLDFKRYGSLEYEFSTPKDEVIRQVLVDRLLEQEEVQEGGANKLWCMSRNLAHITKLSASFEALLDVYFGPVLERELPATREIGYRWADFNLRFLLDAKGSRNRMRGVTNKVRECIRAHTEGTEDKFRILSVAAGSSIAVLRAIYLEGKHADNVELTMIDLSSRAQKQAEKFAHDLGIERSLGEFIQGDVLQTGSYLKGRPRYHCIEKVGLDDYLNNQQEVLLNAALREELVEGGTMIYANMAPHPEVRHLKVGVGWRDMYFRTRTELRKLGEAVGFSAEDLIDINEPLGVYNIIAARKRTIA